MYTVFGSFVAGAGRFRTIGDIGVTLGDKAKVQFDPDKFQAAFAQDSGAVKSLFTQATTGLATLIDHSMTRIVDPVDGLIPQENKTLDSRTQGFQDRIDELDKLLTDKRTRLETQFANMETVLAGLQSQQSALASLTGLTTTTTKSTTTK
jgi:flagellar hook-associated protein 2